MDGNATYQALPQRHAAQTSERRRSRAADQAERARLIKALQNKGAKLSQLARAALADLANKPFVVFDGSELRACQDAATAIAAIVRAERGCSAIDLTAIRTANAE